MNHFNINVRQIEDKRQEILDFLERNFSITYVSVTNDKYQTKHVISNRYKSVYKKYHGKKAKEKGNKNWENDHRVWINIRSINDKRGYGLVFQIKCKCTKWQSRNNKSKNQFAEKWGFPKNNPNIDYQLTHDNLLAFWVVDQALFTFNPSQEYFSNFLNESYKVYELNNLEYGIENQNDITLDFKEINDNNERVNLKELKTDIVDTGDDLPLLKPSGRKREFNKYGDTLKAKVIFEHLVNGLMHRELDEEVLGLDKDKSKGLQSMNILNYLGMKADYKGIFEGQELKKVINILTAKGEDFKLAVSLLKTLEDSDLEPLDETTEQDFDIENIKNKKLQEITHPKRKENSNRHKNSNRKGVKRDYIKEAIRKRKIGLAGEILVLDHEKQILLDAGCNELAERVKHISVELGDGLGYDILSYTIGGEEKFIEIKTTSNVNNTSFFIEDTEVKFSKENSEKYYLYRVYNLNSEKPSFYVVKGDVSKSFNLTAKTYIVD